MIMNIDIWQPQEKRITRKSITYNYMLYKGVVVSKINNHYSIVCSVDELDSVRLSLIRCTFQYPWSFVS